MRPTLQNQPQIGALSQWLLEALRALVTAIQTGWNQQHQGDGSHGAVTATGLTVTPGTTALGKLNLASVTYVDDGIPGQLDDFTTPGLTTTSYLRIVPIANPTIITGIDATGRQRGDLLLLANCDYALSPDDIWLNLEDTASQAANRFADTTASPGSPFILQGSRAVWLVYDYQEQEAAVTPLGGRWRIIDQA